MKAVKSLVSWIAFCTTSMAPVMSFALSSTRVLSTRLDNVIATNQEPMAGFIAATESRRIMSNTMHKSKSIKSTTRIYSTKGRNDNRQSITSSVISNLAVLALKLRLANHSGVSCDVEASSKSLLLKSSVGPVTVKGRGWSSPLGLTCRAIEACVNECQLDMSAVLQRRKLILTTPAVGKAMVALDGIDFGNFLTHPLLEKQIPKIAIGKFEFDKNTVVVQENEGRVIFYGYCGGVQWKCILKRVESDSPTMKRAAIEVSPVLSEPSLGSIGTIKDELEQDLEAIGIELSMVMTQFFNDLVFELDGTFLSFEDMKIHRPRGKNAQVLMALGITVKKFPSPGVAF